MRFDRDTLFRSKRIRCTRARDTLHRIATLVNLRAHVDLNYAGISNPSRVVSIALNKFIMKQPEKELLIDLTLSDM